MKLKIPSTINKLCMPAKVYLVLSIISIILYMISMYNVHETVINAVPEGEGVEQYTLHGLIINVIFTIVWIIILNYICQFKYGKKIAWFIVLLPFFFMALMFIGIMCALSFIALQTEKTKSLQKELIIEKRKQIPDDKPSDKPSFGSQNGEEYISDLLK